MATSPHDRLRALLAAPFVEDAPQVRLSLKDAKERFSTIVSANGSRFALEILAENTDPGPRVYLLKEKKSDTEINTVCTAIVTQDSFPDGKELFDRFGVHTGSFLSNMRKLKVGDLEFTKEWFAFANLKGSIAKKALGEMPPSSEKLQWIASLCRDEKNRHPKQKEFESLATNGSSAKEVESLALEAFNDMWDAADFAMNRVDISDGKACKKAGGAIFFPLLKDPKDPSVILSNKYNAIVLAGITAAFFESTPECLFMQAVFELGALEGVAIDEYNSFNASKERPTHDDWGYHYNPNRNEYDYTMSNLMVSGSKTVEFDARLSEIDVHASDDQVEDLITTVLVDFPKYAKFGPTMALASWAHDFFSSSRVRAQLSEMLERDTGVKMGFGYQAPVFECINDPDFNADWLMNAVAGDVTCTVGNVSTFRSDPFAARSNSVVEAPVGRTLSGDCGSGRTLSGDDCNVRTGSAMQRTASRLRRGPSSYEGRTKMARK